VAVPPDAENYGEQRRTECPRGESPRRVPPLRKRPERRAVKRIGVPEPGFWLRPESVAEVEAAMPRSGSARLALPRSGCSPFFWIHSRWSEALRPRATAQCPKRRGRARGRGSTRADVNECEALILGRGECYRGYDPEGRPHAAIARGSAFFNAPLRSGPVRLGSRARHQRPLARRCGR